MLLGEVTVLRPVPEEAAAGGLQGLGQAGTGPGLGAQFGAASRSTIEGEMDSRVREQRPQNAVLDVVEGESAGIAATRIEVRQGNEAPLEDRFAQRPSPHRDDFPDAFQRQMVEHQRDRPGVVGVDPESEAVLPGPGREGRGRCRRQVLQVCVESRALGSQTVIVDATALDVGAEQLAPGAMVWLGCRRAGGDREQGRGENNGGS